MSNLIKGGIALAVGAAVLGGKDEPKTPTPVRDVGQFAGLGLTGGPATPTTLERAVDQQLQPAVVGQLVRSAPPPPPTGPAQPPRLPGQRNPIREAEKRGEKLSLKNDGDLRLLGTMIAGGAIVKRGANRPVITGDLRAFLASARANQAIDASPAYMAKMRNEIADRLVAIRSLGTHNWKPVNKGIFEHGENKYIVPSKSRTEIMGMLQKYDPIDFVFEYAILETVNAATRAIKGDNTALKNLTDGISKLASKIVADTTKGISTGGPWGALVGAIKGAVESALKQAFQGLIDASEKKGKENQSYAEILRAIDEMADMVGGVKFPLYDMGYAMKIVNPNPPADIAIPDRIAVFAQRAAQDNSLLHFSSFGIAPQWLPQGLYSGPGLWAYQMAAGDVEYSFTHDHGDHVQASFWRTNPGYKGGL